MRERHKKSNVRVANKIVVNGNKKQKVDFAIASPRRRHM